MHPRRFLTDYIDESLQKANQRSRDEPHIRREAGVRHVAFLITKSEMMRTSIRTSLRSKKNCLGVELNGRASIES